MAVHRESTPEPSVAPMMSPLSWNGDMPPPMATR
ncbi:Uncharacterised protein [Mycobacteroides abscessus subsp. abscessus]|nr:Uncharacterised protein [Mycobacteroides abscessus subsp. abscessus]